MILLFFNKAEIISAFTADEHRRWTRLGLDVKFLVSGVFGKDREDIVATFDSVQKISWEKLCRAKEKSAQKSAQRHAEACQALFNQRVEQFIAHVTFKALTM